MRIVKIWSLVFGAALAIAASCSSVEDPADQAFASARTATESSSAETPQDDSAAQLVGGTTNSTCIPNRRVACVSAILCEGNGIANGNTCPNGNVCCVFANPGL
jgi:hypothetical protein